MELLTAIALLCQIGNGDSYTFMQRQLQCQQSYIHCVNVKNDKPKHEALERCVLERKL